MTVVAEWRAGEGGFVDAMHVCVHEEWMPCCVSQPSTHTWMSVPRLSLSLWCVCVHAVGHEWSVECLAVSSLQLERAREGGKNGLLTYTHIHPHPHLHTVCASPACLLPACLNVRA